MRQFGGITIDEKIQTLHPEGKAGVNISKVKYDQIRTAIVESLKTHEELTFNELRDQVSKRIAGDFEGSVSWYYTTVKLDLEARGTIERVGSRSPQKIRLNR